MILIDTTVLVYALGADQRLRAPCRALLELARDGQVRAHTTVEVVQEFTHVRSRRWPRAEAATRAREYALGFAPLVRPDEDDLAAGLDIFQTIAGLGPFDAVLAAVALRRRWALASADQSFGDVPGLRHLDPSSPTFLGDLDAAG
ncbi:MAG: type II toxin-antitoxin system VapC family toxin [Actinomycetota bacterium]|nr:type II toxin-antitoxin system VapC family toxin [Actinomycetota bacterium]